jgi:hypothetical protein
MRHGADPMKSGSRIPSGIIDGMPEQTDDVKKHLNEKHIGVNFATTMPILRAS